MAPEPMTMGDAVRSIRALSARSIDSDEALEAWYKDADALWEALKQSGNILERMPNVISHYLSDAGLRSKDAEYRLRQEEELFEGLDALEALEQAKDVEPPPDDKP